MASDSPPPAPHAAGLSRVVRTGLVVFGLGAIATVVSVIIFAVGVHDSSAPTWLATAAAVLTPTGLAIAFAGLWREHRRDVRAVRAGRSV